MTSSLEGKLVRSAAEAAGRIYLVVGGVKRWIMTPDAFRANGWRFEDVLEIELARLDAIPTSPVVIGGPSSEERNRARARVAAPFLEGRGIELGAGLDPQPLPAGATSEIFELRSTAEMARMFGVERAALPAFLPLDAIAARFPSGASFLLAHNVLEHCADPIGTLLGWSALVCDGGVLVVGVPCNEYCPDDGRVVPPIEHVVLDHLLGRDAESFESREHAYSCAAGWLNAWEDWLPLDKREVAARMHATARMPKLDVHWHAFTPRLYDELLQATARFAPRPLHPLAFAGPHLEGDRRTPGDLVAVLRVGARRDGDPCPGWAADDVLPKLEALRAALADAARRVPRGT